MQQSVAMSHVNQTESELDMVDIQIQIHLFKQEVCMDTQVIRTLTHAQEAKIAQQ